MIFLLLQLIVRTWQLVALKQGFENSLKFDNFLSRQDQIDIAGSFWWASLIITYQAVIDKLLRSINSILSWSENPSQ